MLVGLKSATSFLGLSEAAESWRFPRPDFYLCSFDRPLTADEILSAILPITDDFDSLMDRLRLSLSVTRSPRSNLASRSWLSFLVTFLAGPL